MSKASIGEPRVRRTFGAAKYAVHHHPTRVEVNAIMHGLATLRPQLVSALLQHCSSIKAKRLFLALADQNRHAWLPHVNLQGVDLGHGKRALVQGGKLNTKYQITLPKDLDEPLG